MPKKPPKQALLPNCCMEADEQSTQSGERCSSARFSSSTAKEGARYTSTFSHESKLEIDETCKAVELSTAAPSDVASLRPIPDEVSAAVTACDELLMDQVVDLTSAAVSDAPVSVCSDKDQVLDFLSAAASDAPVSVCSAKRSCDTGAADAVCEDTADQVVVFISAAISDAPVSVCSAKQSCYTGAADAVCENTAHEVGDLISAATSDASVSVCSVTRSCNTYAADAVCDNTADQAIRHQFPRILSDLLDDAPHPMKNSAPAQVSPPSQQPPVLPLPMGISTLGSQSSLSPPTGCHSFPMRHRKSGLSEPAPFFLGSSSPKKSDTAADPMSSGRSSRNSNRCLTVPGVCQPEILRLTVPGARARSSSLSHDQVSRDRPLYHPSEDESEHSCTVSSRRPSTRSARSFNQNDVANSDFRLVRRRASFIVTNDLHNKVRATPGQLSTLLDLERNRLATKCSSRAFENDRDRILLERHLIADVKRERHSAPSATMMGFTFAVTPTPDAIIENPAPATGPACAKNSPRSVVDDEDLCKYLGWVSPLKWSLTIIIAVLIGLQASSLIMGSHHIVHWKLQLLDRIVVSSDMGHSYAFLFLLSYALPACFVAALLVVYVAPHAGGSGIPEIKAYLNGIALPHAFTFSTWLSRSLGLLLVTSAGLFAGTEGPFAHIGGIIASAFSDGVIWGSQSYWPVVLMGHRNQCELISQGAAMGVAAAFGAPVGGILFSLEEASSHWSKHLTWRTFMGTMVAAVVAKLAKSGFTEIHAAGFIEFPDKNASFEVWELGAFAFLASLTGLLGALFCNTVSMTLRLRRYVFQLARPTKWSKRARLVEVMFVSFFTTAICFWPAVALGCTAIVGPRRLSETSEGLPDLSGMICKGRDYSSMAFILLQPKEVVIKTLFSRDMAEGTFLDIPSLCGCFAIVWCTTLLTFGSAVPVGLFIPNILAGACLGRIAGQILLDFGFSVHPGVYALMGSAGALGGFSRMTISLAVIFLEITNNVYLLLPLMLVIMTSKQLADRFGPSVYDIVLESNPDIHLLEDGLSEDHHLVLTGLTVHDVCTAEVLVVQTAETAEQIMNLLIQSTFAAYPIVDAQGRLVGMVSRTKLLAQLSEYNGQAQEGTLINLMQLAGEATEVTNWKTPVPRAFRHFCSTGLQHLCVIDERHVLLGILTRTDFARLCRSGHHGVDEVRKFIHRKQAAFAAGLMEGGGRRSQTGGAWHTPSGSTTDEECNDSIPGGSSDAGTPRAKDVTQGSSTSSKDCAPNALGTGGGTPPRSPVPVPLRSRR